MFNPEIHHRQSIRLRDFDYSANWAYFVTICTQERECLFGGIDNGEMVLNEAGRMVELVWQAVPHRYKNVVLDEFVIMPNHFHGIVCIVGAPLAAPDVDVRRYNTGDTIAENKGAAIAENKGAAIAENKGAAIAENKGAASSAPTLGKIMRTFKSISAIAVNRVISVSTV